MKTDRYLIIILFALFYTYCLAQGFAQVESPEHPSIYWIDADGCLHRIVNTQVSVGVTSDPADAAEAKVMRILALLDRVENLVPGVRNATSLAVDVAREKLYWAEQTGDRTGRLRRANLDGTNVQLVKDLTSAPHGLALDTTNDKIYLTNSWGKVQRLNLDGSNFQPNLVKGLKSPTGITVDTVNQKLYWTEETGIQRANLDGTDIQNIIPSLGTPVRIALGIIQPDAGTAAAPAAVKRVPDETALYANYPNPFNPETWIPYQLATDADVTLRIYAVNGELIRTLALGAQAAGIYETRRRAAYWDGRNAFGESVASGLYFYSLSAGDFTATRKMLIVK